MQDLLAKVLDVLDAMIVEDEGHCTFCREEDFKHIPECVLGQVLDEVNEALEDPFNS